MPISAEQRRTLNKELRQAGVLAKLGNSVYLTPERTRYKQKVTDALVNGVPFEFRNVENNVRKIETRFGKAKEKGKEVNVFLFLGHGQLQIKNPCLAAGFATQGVTEY